MTSEQEKRLEYPFGVDEIEWKPCQVTKDKTKALVNAFVDSRAIQNRLDAVLGRNNWQDNFIYIPGAVYVPKKDKDTAIMSCICTISIYDEQRKEWISKSDGAGNTDIEPIKGGFSNAFKRAASMWGIGRYLYNMPDIWVNLKDEKYINPSERPRLNKHYNQFVSSYLAVTGPKSNNECHEPNKKNMTLQNKSGQTEPSISIGTKDEKTEPFPQSIPKNACRILDLKISKGKNGIQTLVTLENSKGNKLDGYIKGESSLKTGQFILNPKIITKNAPVVGDYHIIESYQVA